MSERRRPGEFRRAADVRPEDLRMPRGRARELVLGAAWEAVAGEVMARRAAPLGIKRGVLEIRVADERWVATVADLVPTLAARLAAARPELGIKRLRLVRPHDTSPRKPEPIPAADRDPQNP